MEAPQHLLRLPVEVLQSIAQFVDRTDLPTLRLVSRDLGFTIFDDFAMTYLRDLRCYVMDPARLKRLKSITSREHLVRKVQKVTLCRDSLELKKSSAIRLAPGKVSGIETYDLGHAQRFA